MLQLTDVKRGAEVMYGVRKYIIEDVTVNWNGLVLIISDPKGVTIKVDAAHCQPVK